MEENIQKNTEIASTKLKHHTLTKNDIERLFAKVNTGRDYYVNVKSHALVDKIIELWFQSQGYDLWDNPYPEVEEWSTTVGGEINFTYTPNE